MSRSATLMLAMAAGALLLIGSVVGFLPYSANHVPCGSAFVASSGPFEQDLRDSMASVTDIAANADVGTTRRPDLAPLARAFDD